MHDDIRQRTVTGSAGALLTCRYTGVDPTLPSVLIALPFGVPATVANAACATLGPFANVVTWESRYILNLDQAFSGDEPAAPANHVEDMIRILAAFGIDTCCLIGYCSGAGISLLAAVQHPDVFTELLLVNGEYQLFKQPGHPSTDYQRSIDRFLPVVSTSRRETRFIFEKKAEISRAQEAERPAAPLAYARPGWDAAAEAELDEQINRSFNNAESLFRYARNYMAYRDFDALALAARVRQRTRILTGGRDVHSRMEHSEAVGDAIAGARIYVDALGDHYEFCRPGSPILIEIATWLRVITKRGPELRGIASHV